MNDYDRYFVTRMERISGTIDFEILAREALGAWFGGAADALLSGLGPAALHEPEVFVREMSRIFGRGALGICEPIIKYVDRGLYSKQGDSPILDLINKLGPPQGGLAEPNKVLLHEHRIKDEQGNYPDNAD